MRFAGINFIGVLMAAALAWAGSTIWHMALRKLRTSALDTRPDQAREARSKAAAALPFVYAFIADFVIAWVLAGVLGHLGPGQVTLRNGVICAAFCWFGFILTTMTVNYSFAGRASRFLLIDCGDWLIVLLIAGAVVGAAGV
jgi:hypothetical protein